MKNIGSKGFGLLEVMVASAILAGLAVASMTMFKTQNTAQKTVEKKYEVTVLAQQMRTILSKPSNCFETFQNVNSSSGSVNNLKKFIDPLDPTTLTNVFPINTDLPEGLKIKSYALSKSFSNLLSNETMLVVTFLKGKGSLTDEMQKTIKLIITEDGGGKVTSCYATSSGTEIWAYTTTGKDIFFNGGSVAIGNADPKATLDVTGEVRVGNSGVACSAVNEGSMRYNPAIKNMEFCNGTDWKGIGEGSGNMNAVGNTGHWKFPGGLILQWGFDNKNGDFSVHKFDIDFPNKCFVTIVTTWGRGVRGTNGHNHVLTCNQNNFTATIEVLPVNAGAGWIAIGF